MEQFFWAFIIGGIICVIGQLLLDVGKLTPAHTMCTLVVAGSILSGFGYYDKLTKFAGVVLLYRLAVLEIHWLKVPFKRQSNLE